MVQFHFLDDDDGDATSASPPRRGTRCRARSWTVGVHVGKVAKMADKDNIYTGKWLVRGLVKFLPALP